MTIQTTDKSGTPALTVKGQIGSLQDTVEFKQALRQACMSSKNGAVSVYFEECIILPSSIIGALLQKKEIDKMEIKTFVRQKELSESIQRLRLADILGLTSY